MRRMHRHAVQITAIPCLDIVGETGGVARAEIPALQFAFRASVAPDKQSEQRARGTLRPRERRLLLADPAVRIHQGDHLYFPGDARCWRVMQARSFPGHTSIEAEVEG
ncbi:MAG: hypothetical protein GX810_06770 [Clostridiales bacterium]|nr:hypothetical protein [Clostridiales bacterium]